jgi:hypothetical protein
MSLRKQRRSNIALLGPLRQLGRKKRLFRPEKIVKTAPIDRRNSPSLSTPSFLSPSRQRNNKFQLYTKLKFNSLKKRTKRTEFLLKVFEGIRPPRNARGLSLKT